MRRCFSDKFPNPSDSQGPRMAGFCLPLQRQFISLLWASSWLLQSCGGSVLGLRRGPLLVSSTYSPFVSCWIQCHHQAFPSYQAKLVFFVTHTPLTTYL